MRLPSSRALPLGYKSYARKCGALETELLEQAPDFLIVAPAKTGTTWLARNLERHPNVFVPNEKELRYFCTYYRARDINWYLRWFQPGGDKVKGEATPTYSILPPRAIRYLRQLFPDLKLIFLLREPIARAWSHLRHTRKYGEARFLDQPGPMDSLSLKEMMEGLLHEWTFSQGDYEAILRRYLDYFPAEQCLVLFYERIERDPIGLLTDVCHFIGAPLPTDWSTLRVDERIFEGEPFPMPPELEVRARALFQPSLAPLETLLQRHFALSLPEEWERTRRGVVYSRPLEGLDAYKGYPLDREGNYFIATPPPFREKAHIELRARSLMELTWRIDQDIARDTPIDFMTGVYPPILWDSFETLRLLLLIPERKWSRTFNPVLESPSQADTQKDADFDEVDSLLGAIRVDRRFGDSALAALPYMTFFFDRAEYWAGLGESLHLANDRVGAEAHYKRAISVDRRCRRGYLPYARLLLWTERYEEARALIQCALDELPEIATPLLKSVVLLAEPSPEFIPLLLRLSCLMVEQDDSSAAVASFALAIRSGPVTHPGWTDIPQRLKKLERLDITLKMALQLVSFLPDDEEAILLAGRILIALEAAEAAQMVWQQFLERKDPASSSKKRASFFPDKPVEDVNYGIGRAKMRHELHEWVPSEEELLEMRARFKADLEAKLKGGSSAGGSRGASKEEARDSRKGGEGR